jgi:hypothetical protein
VDAGGFQAKSALCDAGNDVLSRVLSGGNQPVLSINAGNVSSIAERFADSVDYPAVHNLDIENLGPAYRPFVRRLSSFIRVEHDGIRCYFAVTDRLDLDLDLKNIGICPV